MTSIPTPTPREGPAAGAPIHGFQQRLGLFDSTMLVAGAMIGSGIFIVSTDIAADMGSAGWLLAVWVLTGIMTVIGALSYGELAAMMPHAGGQYIYLREAYSPMWGFLYGWTFFLVIQTGTIAAVAVAFAKFLGVLVPELGTDAILFKAEDINRYLALPLPWLEKPLVIFERKEFTVSAGQLVGAGLVVLLTLINCRGVQEGKWIQNVFTVTKVLALVLLIVFGLTVVVRDDAIQRNFTDLWGGAYHTPAYKKVQSDLVASGGLLVVLMVMGGAMVGSLFSSDAWNNVTFTAGEVKNPRRTLPMSLALGTGMVIVLYLMANVVYLVSLPLQGNEKAAVEYENRAQRRAEQADEVERLAAQADPVEADSYRRVAVQLRHEVNDLNATAVYQRGIDKAKDKRVGTAVLGLVSPDLGVPIMAVAIMISTFGCLNGLILMGARLNYAMARDRLFFASVGRLNRQGVPAAGLVLQGLWAILLVFSGTYNELLDYVIFAALLFYALTVIGLFVLRRKRPDAPRPYRAFGYPVIPALYVVLCIVIMFDLLLVKPVYTWPGLLIVLAGFPVYFLWRWRAGATASEGKS